MKNPVGRAGGAGWWGVPVGRASVPAIAEVAARDGLPTKK